ncbi:MAG: NUDIX domain-containing protein [Clostridiales bacterium]|nr:NUDIX domain-containing protein [Clostridiales bacterium]
MADYIMDLRRIVGKRPLLQVGASVICVSAAGEILLQKRRDNHCWCYPGGAVELDEVVEDAARRELHEEMGIKAGQLKLWGVFSGPQTHYVYPNGDEVSCVDIVYTCHDYEGTVKPDPSEVEDFGFFAPEDLPQPLSPPIAHILLKFAEELASDRRG